MSGQEVRLPEGEEKKEREQLKRKRANFDRSVFWFIIAVLAVPAVLHFGLQIGMGLVLVQLPFSATLKMAILMIGALGLSLALLVFGLPKITKRFETSADEMGVAAGPAWLDIAFAPLGLVASLMVGVVLMAVVSLIFPDMDLQKQQELGFQAGMMGVERIVAMLVLTVIVPVGEELIYRGWIYGKLRSKFKAPLAILLSSLLFAVMHGQVNVAVAVLPVGVVACLMREWTGTIWAGALTHMLKNGLAFYLLILQGVL